MSTEPWSGRTLRCVTPKGTRYWRATREGAEIIQEAWTDGKAPKVTRKSLGDAASAEKELQKSARKKLLEDFVYLPPEGASPEEPVFSMALPGGGPSAHFDVSPDGRTLFVGAGRGDPTAQVLFADLTTGEVKRIPVEPDPPRPQLFIHGAVVSADGREGLVGLNARVRTVRAETGAWAECASLLRQGYEHVNPFCVRPQRDHEHARVALVHAPHLEVRALSTGEVLMQAPLGTITAECRGIALSPSGRLVLAYVVSRSIAYGHADAGGDSTHEFRIHRVSDGALAEVIPITEGEVNAVGFTPDDRALLVRFGYEHRLMRISLGDGARSPLTLEGVEALHRATWSWTPGGELVLPADYQKIGVYDLSTGARRALLHHERGECERVVCSRDGGLVVVGGQGGFTAYRLPGPGVA